MRTEQGIRNKKLSDAKYAKTNTVNAGFKLNRKTDADILEKLSTVSNRQGYIKRLIREDIARSKGEL